jgi:predicted enzyme related to lactoylglutathione lyase
MTDPMKQHGAFSWNELMTNDIAGAKTFYSSMFGWALEDHNDGMPYTVAKIKDKECAGFMTIPPEEEGMPVAWGGYVTVDDVEESVKQAIELGGTVLMEPRDIPKVGRFSVIADPQGAALTIITYYPNECE